LLAALNGVAFYVAFPTGLLESYVYPRAAPLAEYAAMSVVAAALLLTTLYALTPIVRPWPMGALLGALVGALASAPERLAVYAVVRGNPWHECIVVAWTTASWAVVGWAISRSFSRSTSNVHVTV
jgi:hypothetical protein